MLLPIFLLLAMRNSPNPQLQIVEQDTFSDANNGLQLLLKAVLPDGSHVVLTCSNVSDPSCSTIKLLKPKKLPPQEVSCQDSVISSPNVGVSRRMETPGILNTTRRTCVYRDMGWFDFTRSGSYISIRGRHITSVLHISGPWRENSQR